MTADQVFKKLQAEAEIGRAVLDLVERCKAKNKKPRKRKGAAAETPPPPPVLSEDQKKAAAAAKRKATIAAKKAGTPSKLPVPPA